MTRKLFGEQMNEERGNRRGARGEGSTTRILLTSRGPPKKCNFREQADGDGLREGAGMEGAREG